MKDSVWTCRSLRLAIFGLMAGLTGLSVRAESPATEYLSDHPERLLAMQQNWGVLGFDTAAHDPQREGAPLQIGERLFAKGLGHHAAGTITVLLDGEYDRFEAEVGLQPCEAGSVVFRVLVDGAVKFDSGVRRKNDPAVPVRVDVVGAQELQLESGDAGDGITCDVANWAEARLTRSARANRAMLSPGFPPVNIVPSGRIMTCDPQRMHGTKATRLEEFPAADYVLDRTLLPGRGGAYQVPVTNGLACLGLEWLNRRLLKSLALEVAGDSPMPATNDVRVEAWFGASLWQGEWKPLNGQLAIAGRRLEFEISPKSPAGGLLRTWKVRWVWPAKGGSASVNNVAAYTRARWENVILNVELGQPTGVGASSLPKRAGLGVVDGELLEPRVGTLRAGEPVAVKVRAARPSSLTSEQTQLRLQRGSEQVTVAVEDVLAKGVVYVPSAGVLVCRADRPMTMAAYQRQIADKQTILEQVRALPDQTLAQALARTHHDTQDDGPVMLSLNCDNAKVVVERYGDLLFRTLPCVTPDWYSQVARLNVRLAGDTGTNRSRTLEGDWLPIPVIATEAQGVVLRQRTFVAPTDPDGTNPGRLLRPPVCVVEFSLTNTGAAEANPTLSLSLDAGKVTGMAFCSVPGGIVLRFGDRVIGRWVVAAPLALEGEGASLKLAGSLAPGASATATLFLALDSQTLPDGLEVARLRSATERHWQAALAGAAQIETPEPFLNHLIRSSQVRCLIAARNEAEGQRVAAWIAAMSYGPLESEAHSVIRGMDFLGHHDFARRGLDFFIHRYNTNGFLTTGYTTFGTGWHLWTLGEHYQLTRDTQWLRAHAGDLARVGRWIIAQKEITKRTDADGKPLRGAGLMPPAVLADWDVFAQYYCLGAYYAAALRELGNALGSIGHPEAARFQRESQALTQATLAAFERTAAEAPVVPLRDGTWVPYYPSQAHTPGPLARSFPGEDAGRSWAYNVELGAHQMVPPGTLSAFSPRTGWMLDHLEDVSYLESGWFDYPAEASERDWFNLGGFAKVQPYYARNAEIYALRDDIKPFVRTYFNSLASLANREVLTFWEHFRHSGAWDKTHETGYFLHQTRTMLVTERADALWLAPFVPSAWLADGRTLRVDNAPTRFGRVSYRIASHVAQGTIEVKLTPPTDQPPKAIVLRLRHPEGKPIRSVTVNGKPWRNSSPKEGTITLAPSAGPLVIQANY